MAMGMFLLWGGVGLLYEKLSTPKTSEEKNLIWNAVWDSTAAAVPILLPLVWLLLVKIHVVPLSTFLVLMAMMLILLAFLSVRTWRVALRALKPAALALPVWVLLVLPLIVEGVPLTLLFFKLAPRLVHWLT